MLKLLFFTSRYLKETPVQIENGFYTLRCIGWWNIIYKEDKSEFVERFPEFSLFYRLFSPLDSEMICIFPYFYPCEESAREIREIFI